MNLADKTDEQLRREKAAILRELSRRRKKRPKPKQRKPVDREAVRRAELWDAFKLDHCDSPGAFCWACGRTAADKPSWWYGKPWLIERMHFVHSGTGRVVRDPRLVIAACSGCHGHYHQTLACWNLPRLTDGNCAWLKMEMDGDNYDPVFIANNNIRGCIVPMQPPQVFFSERQRFVHFGKGVQ